MTPTMMEGNTPTVLRMRKIQNKVDQVAGAGVTGVDNGEGLQIGGGGRGDKENGVSKVGKRENSDVTPLFFLFFSTTGIVEAMTPHPF